MKKYIILITLCLSLSFAEAKEYRIMTSDSVQLYAKVQGRGVPCIYLHGGPGSGSYWLEKYFGDYLEKHFTMIYLDQRGVGRSNSPANGDYSMDRMLKDFEEVRAHLGFGQWITLGHSFGGILQVAYCEKYPEATKAMIMMNCTLCMDESFRNSWLPKISEFLGERYIDDPTDSHEAIISKMRKLIPKLDSIGASWKMAYASAKDEELLNSTYGEIANWNSGFASVALTVDDFWKDFRPQTSAIKVPVLFFHGNRDWSIGVDHYKGVRFPNMMLREANCSHIPFLSERAVAENAISDFIDRYGINKE